MKNNSTLKNTVVKSLNSLSVVDIHTHLFDPGMGNLLLWGIDELLTYHYLIAELFRAKPEMNYKEFWGLSKTQQADLIWEELFLKRSPISEACRGVVTVLNELGLDIKTRNLNKYRSFFKKMDVKKYTDIVFKKANVAAVYMTNDPLHPLEHETWQKGFERDPRFLAALRLDSAIIDWPKSAELLREYGYNVDDSLSGNTISEIKRYLAEWIKKMDAKYMAISLPPTFTYPDINSLTTNLLTKTAFPVAKEFNIPIALMIGVKKLVNPHLILAGDSVGKSSIETVEKICLDFSDINFLITMLSRENMHELCVAARKFKNMLPFGCWWFLNNPSLIKEITAMRLELLGLTFIPQHSDCRILDQLVYKWKHSREIIADVLYTKYLDIARSGWHTKPSELERDIASLLNGTLIKF
jgi:hypothetical protein